MSRSILVPLDGSPFGEQALADYADEHKIDLVVLATRGRGGWSRLVLGSVADKVIRAAKQPVLVFRSMPAEDESS